MEYVGIGVEYAGPWEHGVTGCERPDQFIFNNAEKVTDFKDLINYSCMVNAVDGSVLEAYSLQGMSGNTVYYDHEP